MDRAESMVGGISRRGLVGAGALLAMAGCAATPKLLISTGQTFPALETLLAAKAGPDALTIRVASRGCAAKVDFVFHVDRVAGQAVVAFARRRLETCKGPLSAANLVFSYQELGLTRADRIVIANPISPLA